VRLARSPETLESAGVNADILSGMLARDGEDHRRLRLLVSKAFTPRMVELLRPPIQANAGFRSAVGLLPAAL
jgi:cytochrome P450